MKKMILFALLSVLGSAAMADQCQLVTRTQATKAVSLLMKAKRVQSLCEPCGESKAQDVAFTSVEVQKVKVDKTYLEVSLDGKSIDLAYTFVDGINLADLVACPAEGVSHQLKQ